MAGLPVIAISLPAKGIDRSTDARPSLHLTVVNGNVAIGRYLTAHGDSRGITLDEYHAITSAGLYVWLIDEEGNGDHALKGYQQGHTDGSLTASRATELGWPIGRPIYGATDRDIAGTQIPTAIDYYKGYRDGLGGFKAGAYGGKLLLSYLKAYGIVEYFWSSNATSWDHGATVPGLHIQQWYTPTPAVPATDNNSIYQLDFGQVPFQQNKDDDVPAYSEWPDASKWEEAVSTSNLIIGEDTPPNADGNYVGQRPPSQYTNKNIVKVQAHQEQVLGAILTKLGVPFTWDQGSINLSE